MNDAVRKYLAELGRKGGLKSKRKLTREQSLKMHAARWGAKKRAKPPKDDETRE